MSGTSTLRWRRGLVVLAALLVASASGCNSRKWVPVSGRVTINGQPAEGILVYFSPVAPPGTDPLDPGLPSYGKTAADGRFTLAVMDAKKDWSGAWVGAHTVTLDDERTFEKLNTKSRVPPKWKATFEVPPAGTDKADFELSGR